MPNVEAKKMPPISHFRGGVKNIQGGRGRGGSCFFFTMVYRMSHEGGGEGRKISLTTSGGSFQKM